MRRWEATAEPGQVVHPHPRCHGYGATCTILGCHVVGERAVEIVQAVGR